jgi:hypothetical protein
MPGAGAVHPIKIYLLNSFQIVGSSKVDYENVEAVMAHASECALENSESVEVWRGTACVGRIVAPLQRDGRPQ